VERSISANLQQLEKSPTGIPGLDEIVNGGLPKGRTTLVCGGPGCGKTLLAMEFLIHGIQKYNEPGVFIAFEETPEELAQNVASLGFDLARLLQENKLFVDYIYLERSEIEETGLYDLDGLFLRLADAVQTVGAKRLVLDTIETLFAGLANEGIIRAELRRLFRWIKENQLTAVVTGERGEGSLTRYGLEEYVSDCVILLDQRQRDQVTTRRLRVVKYRGSAHRNDEHPFLIGDEGIWVLPLSSMKLAHPASNERISTGIPRLDTMLDGRGYFRGSTILVAGAAGTGKTSLAATLVDSTCQNNQKCLYFAFEESPPQIMRNMSSIGIDLQRWVDAGLLQFQASRPSMDGMEQHLLSMEKAIEEMQPSVVVVDPASNLDTVATQSEVRSMLVRLVDFLKNKGITTLFTSLMVNMNDLDAQVGISSLMDTWILLRNRETNGEHNRVLNILKARGIAHSSQVRELRLSDNGIELLDVYVGPQGMLTGTARIVREALDKIEDAQQKEEIERLERNLERKRQRIAGQIAALQTELTEDEENLALALSQKARHSQALQTVHHEIASSRQADQNSR
jgi:circadian clock protein KaiC